MRSALLCLLLLACTEHGESPEPCTGQPYDLCVSSEECRAIDPSAVCQRPQFGPNEPAICMSQCNVQQPMCAVGGSCHAIAEASTIGFCEGPANVCSVQ